jgi:hypothetical protein
MKKLIVILIFFIVILNCGCVTNKTTKNKLVSININLSNINYIKQKQFFIQMIEKERNSLKNNLLNTLGSSTKIFIPPKTFYFKELAKLNLDEYIYIFHDVIISNDSYVISYINVNNKIREFKKEYSITGIGYLQDGLFDVQRYFAFFHYRINSVPWNEGKYYKDYDFPFPVDAYIYDNITETLNNWLLLNKYTPRTFPNASELIIGKSYFIHFENIYIRNNIGGNSYAADNIEQYKREGYQFIISNLPRNMSSGINYVLLFNGYIEVITQGGFVRILPEFIFVERIVLPKIKTNYERFGHFLNFGFSTEKYIDI